MLDRADLHTPLEQFARAASMSETTSWIPCTDPGVDAGMPLPMAIEQAEPAGVSCTTRMSSLMRVSWSTTKPTCSP